MRNNPDTEYSKQANKTLRKLKDKSLETSTANVYDMKKADIFCCRIATHAVLSCGPGQGAFIIFPLGNGKVVLLAWQLKKLS